MNCYHTAVKNRLAVTTLSNLLLISINGPYLRAWNIEKFAIKEFVNVLLVLENCDIFGRLIYIKGTCRNRLILIAQCKCCIKCDRAPYTRTS